MVSRLLIENKKKSKISVNCFLALGACLGYKMTILDQEDDYGVDVLLWNQMKRNGIVRDLSTVLHFQLKATQKYSIENDKVKYQIENKTLNDIVQANIIKSTPVILILLILPEEESIDWVSINEDDIRFHKNLFWFHTDSTTEKANEKSKTTIRIPLTNRLDAASLVDVINNFATRKI